MAANQSTVSNPKSNFFDYNFQKLSHIGRGGFGEVYHVRHMIEGEEYAVKIVKFLGLATSHDMSSMSHTSNVGTAQYMAPEIFQPRYTIKVDIYSLAVIAFHLFDLFNISSVFNTKFETLPRNEGTEGKASVGEEGNTPQERHKREERNQSHVSIGVTLGHKSSDTESDRTDQLSTGVMSWATGGHRPSYLMARLEKLVQNEEMVAKRRADEERDRRLEREKHEMKAEKVRQQVVTKATANPESDAEKQKLDFEKTAKPSNNSGSPTGLTATALYDYRAADLDEISFYTNELVTDIEMIDEGWGRGRCGDKVGLFPANYVRLNQMRKSEINGKANDLEIASIVVVIITHLWSPVMTVSTDGVIIYLDSWVVGNSTRLK
ncbi:unnamed protein product [Medioppia subpectinata]|uniref:SH3 domain-containing protein n=1 Tax=Medioppia subpectinata TaxID=1979941 RepID=A0A7R9L003_9ACAR|nr:unnamed protein product [Medioppia subpectinata]CAG2111759.1 unnamed protein product [Medioppia subpectinata]